MSLDRSRPTRGVTPHVYVPLAGSGSGRCVCGSPTRFDGCHVAENGERIPNELGLGRAAATLGGALLAFSESLLGEPAGDGIDPPLTRRQLLDIADALGLDLDQVVRDAR